MKAFTLNRWIQCLLLAFACLGLLQTHAADEIDLTVSSPEVKPFVIPPTAAETQAIREMAVYMVNPSSDPTERYLRQLGFEFEPPPTVEVWREFPALRKIETAFLQADHARPGSGREFLATLSRKMQEDFAAIGQENACANLMLQVTENTPSFTFLHQPPGEVTIPAEYRRVIGELSDYSLGSKVCSPRLALIRNFGLDEDLAYQILREAPDSESALLHGLSCVPKTEHEKALGSLAKALFQEFKPFPVTMRMSLLLGDPPKILSEAEIAAEEPIALRAGEVARNSRFPESNSPDFSRDPATTSDFATRSHGKTATEKAGEVSTSKAGDTAADTPTDVVSLADNTGISTAAQPPPGATITTQDIDRALARIKTRGDSSFGATDGVFNLDPSSPSTGLHYDPLVKKYTLNSPSQSPSGYPDLGRYSSDGGDLAIDGSHFGGTLLQDGSHFVAPLAEDGSRIVAPLLNEAEHSKIIGTVFKGIAAFLVAIFVGIGRLFSGRDKS